MTYEEALHKILIVADTGPKPLPELSDADLAALSTDGSDFRQEWAEHQAIRTTPEMMARMLRRVIELAEEALAEANRPDTGNLPHQCCRRYGIDGHDLGHPPWY